MPHHLFLTGPKQIGKSTILQKMLKKYPGNAGGFYTVRTDAFLPGEYTVHMYDIREKATPSKDNLLFICGKADALTPGRFDLLGVKALTDRQNCSLLVMDELGPHEAKAAHFRQLVLHLLDGNTPILGVLQEPANLYWPEILNHPKARIITVTEENREEIYLDFFS